MTTELRTNALCSGSDVVELIGNYKNEFVSADGSFSELNASINDADDEIYNDYGSPLAKSTFFIEDSDNHIFEFDRTEDTTYRINQAIVRGNSNERFPLTPAGSVNVDNVTVNSSSGSVYYNNVELTASGSDSYWYDNNKNVVVFPLNTLNKYKQLYCEIDYVPRIFHMISKNQAALFLIDSRAVVAGEEVTPTQITRIERRIERYKEAIAPFRAVGSKEAHEGRKYDPRTRDYVTQHRYYEY